MIAKHTATEWKEVKERSIRKTSSHGLLTYSHVRHMSYHILALKGTSLLAVTSPYKNQAGWPFWCPYRNVGFLAYNHAQGDQL